MEPALLTLSSLVGDIGLVGTASLIALHLADRNVSESELMIIVKVDSLATLRNYLRKCEILDYATQVKKFAKDKIAWWHITDLGRSALRSAISLLGLQRGFPSPRSPELIAPDGNDLTESREKNFFSLASSSSSDLIDRSSDQIDPEEEETTGEKIFYQPGAPPETDSDDDDRLLDLLDRRHITGPRREQIERDHWITYDRARNWFDQVDRMATHGFKFRRSKEMYAAACLLNHDDPPALF